MRPASPIELELPALQKEGVSLRTVEAADYPFLRALYRSVRDTDSNIEKILDLGFVGEPVRINPTLLQEFSESHIIPVIAPIGIGASGETYNINADTAAGAIAAAIGASKLIILTDVSGVLNKNKELEYIPQERSLADYIPN